MPNPETTCSTPGGHRYDASGRCEWCDAERTPEDEADALITKHCPGTPREKVRAAAVRFASTVLAFQIDEDLKKLK